MFPINEDFFVKNAGIMYVFVKNAGIMYFFVNKRVLCMFLSKMRLLCGYIDLNTRICGSTPIYAGIVATLGTFSSFGVWTFFSKKGISQKVRVTNMSEKSVIELWLYSI